MADPLTEAHRRAQLALGATVIARMRAAWNVLDPEDLDGTFDQWLAVVNPIIVHGRNASSSLAAAYLVAFRRQTGLGTFAPVVAGPPDDKALTTSLLVTGPVSIRAALGRRVSLTVAADVAEARSAAAGMRWSLNAGRETITETVKADPRAVGYARVTSGNACSFCEMLADRGAVYGADSAEFQAHDGCSCSAEPQYS